MTLSFYIVCSCNVCIQKTGFYINKSLKNKGNLLQRYGRFGKLTGGTKTWSWIKNCREELVVTRRICIIFFCACSSI